MPRKIRRLPQARADRLEIWLHVAEDSLAAADRLTDRLDEVAFKLADFPELGPLRPNLGSDIRICPVDDYLPIYRVAVEAIEIVRILHSARNISPDMLSD